MKPFPIIALFLVGVVLAVGFKQKPVDTDMRVVLSDVSGLSVGALVEWRGVPVGEIGKLQGEPGLGVICHVDLFPEYEGKFYSGIRAQIDRPFFRTSGAKLQLIGLGNPNQPLLSADTFVQEGSALDRVNEFRFHHINVPAFFGVASVFLLFLARGAKRFVPLAFLIAVFAIGLWFVKDFELGTVLSSFLSQGGYPVEVVSDF